MFTGLVEDVGKIVAAARQGDSVELTIAPARMPVDELALGDSVAIDGTCLTVTAKGAGRFTALAGPETLARTTLGTLHTGGEVNLERALRLGDRLGGHLVQGHVDGVGTLASRKPVGPALELTIRAPEDVARYVVEKGSIAIDGISLTVNAVRGVTFTVGIIPHTQDVTTLAKKSVGAKVNLEVDLIAKYVEKLLPGNRTT